MKKYNVIDFIEIIQTKNPDDFHPIVEASPDGKWVRARTAEKLINAYHELEQRFIHQIDTQAYQEMTCIINEALGTLRDTFEDVLQEIENEE